MPSFIPIDFDPFGDGKEIEHLTLTNDSQKEIWLSCIIGGAEANLSYNESISLELEGKLNVAALQNAINVVIARHDALRSNISPNGEHVITYKELPLNIQLEDLTTLETTHQKQRLKEFLNNLLDSPIDLAEGPLFSCHLHKLDQTKYFLTILKHHIIGDGWSTGIILEDLSKFYNAFSKGDTLHLPKPHQMRDYLNNQNQYKKTSDYKEAENYWINLYKNEIPVLDLPTDNPRTAPRSYSGNRLDFVLEQDFVNQIKAVGAKTGSSLVTTLLAAFEIFLYKKTKQRTLVVGLPASGQAATGLTDVVGHCVNLLPLKSTIDPEQTFTAYLKLRKKQILDAYEHQGLTFGSLLEKIQIPRVPSRIPLVPVVFNIDMGMDNAVAFDGLQYNLISNPRNFENFEVFLNATRSKNGLILEWSYSAVLFNQETIKKFNLEYRSILEKIISNPLLSINEIASMKVINALIGNEVYIPDNLTINHLLTDAVNKFGYKTAVSFQGNALTYLQLEEKTNQLASYLTEKGIQSGDKVALSIDRSTEMLIAMWAILKVGASYVPVDPDYPINRIQFMILDSCSGFLITSQKYKNRLKTSCTEMIVEEIWPDLDNYSQNFSVRETPNSGLAYILYTSGSSGKPKGVNITHRNLVNFLLSMQQEPGLHESDRLLAITTISFDIAVLELFLPIICGAQIIIADSIEAKDGRLLLEAIEKNKITVLQATPSRWQMLLDCGWDQKTSLRVFTGGEALSKALAKELLLRATEVWNMYAPTETTIYSIIKKITDCTSTITIGKPIANTNVYILNEQNERLSTEQIGEICISGEGVTNGYLNRPELTSEKFLKDPFSNKSETKLYKTGDLGKILENGEIECLGRIDNQIKIRGQRIELEEIEFEISKLNGIKQSVVLAREDSPNDVKLVAYVVTDDAFNIQQNLTWKDRWDVLYNIGAKENENLEIEDQHIDGALLKNASNSELLAVQAKEWLQTSVDRIKEIKADRIYEIGSGGGQILYEIAPSKQKYFATDFASDAIHNIQLHLAKHPEKWPNVTASVANANDFSAIGSNEIDLVLIHSVAQYFPNSDYLLSVIKGATQILNNGGCIFIGDMQGKDTLEMCHAIDYLPRASESTPLPLFKEIVENRVRIEDELVADPQFFYKLRELYPEITGVDVQLRRGEALNETTKYHYDVWIYVNKPLFIVKPQLVRYWDEVNNLDALHDLLSSHANESVEIKNIYNARTAPDHALIQAIDRQESDQSLSAIKREISTLQCGFNPEVFWQIADKLNFNAHVRWSNTGTDGLFDVVFIPKTDELRIPEFIWSSDQLDLQDLIRTPITDNEIHISKEIIDAWKQNMSEALPSHMVPDDFVILKAFPTTPNSKIDRKALPKPLLKKKGNENISRALTANEQMVMNIWSEVLGIEGLKINDDFFELGGHSLLAVKVMVNIEKETGKRLPLSTLFNNSTIEKLARYISHSNDEKSWDALVPIKTTGNKKPLFLIHGGGLNILLFKSISTYFDDDQPIYGIQALGLNHDNPVPTTIEEIAQKYISEILEVCPDGPYALAGYSLGGFIAFEIAKQLKQMGKEIQLLGIMDTYAGNNEAIDSKAINALKKIKRQFLKIPFFTKSFIQYPKEAIEYQVIVTRRKFDKLLSADTFTTKDVMTDYELKIYKNYNIAHNNYIMKAEDLKVTLFRVTKRLYFIDDMVSLGWNKFAKQGVDIYDIPGDHKTFLFPPNDKEFAKILQQTLNSK